MSATHIGVPVEVLVTVILKGSPASGTETEYRGAVPASRGRDIGTGTS